VKVGDLVKHKQSAGEPGLVVEMTQKKVWRTHIHGKKVEWDKIDPEPHATVLWGHNDGAVGVPVVELEIINENR